MITRVVLQTFAVLTIFATPSLSHAKKKPFAKGIIDLPGAISAKKPIGIVDDHPWTNPYVSGLRIRTGWDNSAPSEGIYNWVQIDECLALAAVTGKFIGLGVIAGLQAPPWLLGGQTYIDGATTINVATLTSPTAKFTKADVGRVIISTYFPAGTTIVSRTSSTAVKTSAAATKSTTTKKPLTFSILSRIPGGATFRVLTEPDEGVMVVPWDPIAKARWKDFIVALAGKYDNHPQFQYLVMSGFQKTGECYLAEEPADVAFFDASAIAAGYRPTDTLPAGLVAWEATVKEIVAQYMASFPNTPLVITGGRPYGGDYQELGQDAMNDIFDWGLATYPTRFGIMNSQLHVTSAAGYFLNAPIVENAGVVQTGLQFLCAGTSDNPDNLPRLCDAPPWGDSRLLSIHKAVDRSCAAGVGFGCDFVEVYEDDVNNPKLQDVLAIHSAELE